MYKPRAYILSGSFWQYVFSLCKIYQMTCKIKPLKKSHEQWNNKIL